MQVQGKVAMVTGASAGIGRQVAGQLAARGAHVLVHGRDARRTAAVASAIGGHPLVADLSDPQQRDRLGGAAVGLHGRVDVLVNNAGLGWAGPFDTMDRGRLRAVLEVDLVAAIELTQAVLPGMLNRRDGGIVFVSSIAGRTGVAGEAVYAAAKAGLDAFAESLRAEAAGSGVHIGVVVPAVVQTGFFDTRGRSLDRRRPRPRPPDVAAAAVLRAIAADKPEVWTPNWLRIAPAVRTLAPAAYRRLSVRFGEPVRLRGSQ